MKHVLKSAEKKVSSRSIIFGAVLFLFVVLTAGCSKITRDNYSRIQVGMEYSEVVAIIGEPTSCSSIINATHCTWGNAKRSIDISLVADKVVFLSSRGL